jgi:succinate-semialdehyde dehydrogenase
MACPCACEQAVMIHKDDLDAVLNCFARNRAVFVDDTEVIHKLANILYVDGALNRDSMRISAPQLAEKVGLSVPKDTRVLLIKANGDTVEALRKEKLSPVTLVYTYSKF